MLAQIDSAIETDVEESEDDFEELLGQLDATELAQLSEIIDNDNAFM